ncbi:MAG: XdhC/CoxI family protein [Pirellulaceae bacterium]|nr:MAG: XdhC/CoxI family protein [Pirellulaceae bacterium]
MREVLREVQRSLDQQRPAVFCRLVETRGSTPQKAGAAMLVYADGSQAGTLGGGCVEAEVKRRALAALGANDPQLLTFLLDHDYGWDDGLICGGRMQILVQPLGNGAVGAYLRRLGELVEAGRGCCEAVVLDSEKSGLPPQALWLFDENKHCRATVPEALPVPSWLQAGLPDLADRPRPATQQGVALLPTLPRCRLLIIGGGHVGKAVADLAADLDFDVWVVDDRAEYVAESRFPRAERRIAGRIAEVLPELPVDHNTYCLIVTRGHHHDEEALYYLATRGARYVGMIGSRRKIRLIFDDLRAAGIPQEALDRVYAPVGIDIGSQTVAEIAVSICAELVAHRNRHGQVPGRHVSQ